jgi:MYXO-CTERM domain-containing protein
MTWSPEAGAVEIELRYDGFMDNGQAACQQGFATDDEAGVTFSHDAAFDLNRVQFLFCGADTTEMVTLVVYRDTGGAVPGEVLFQGDYDVQGSTTALTEIDLTAENLGFAAGESFRVVLRLQHDGPPGLASDADGTATPGRSWIYDTMSSSWAEASAFGVTGDWIMRAYVEVEDTGTGGAGGMPATSTTSSMMAGTGGAGGAGGGDADADADDESCSCGVVGAPERGSGWLAVIALGAFIALRRST